MKTTRLIPMLFLFGTAGCYGETSGTVAYSSGGAYTDGALVEVDSAPGVQVVADYDYPVFYSGGFYYRYDGGHWARSHDYRRGGWEGVRNVPTPVARIDRPERYRHYHAPSRVVHRDGHR